MSRKQPTGVENALGLKPPPPPAPPLPRFDPCNCRQLAVETDRLAMSGSKSTPAETHALAVKICSR